MNELERAEGRRRGKELTAEYDAALDKVKMAMNRFLREDSVESAVAFREADDAARVADDALRDFVQAKIRA